MKMIDRSDWGSFRKSGMLWFVNRLLHFFGWAIVFEPETGACWPARCRFRGFSERDEEDGYRAVAAFALENSDEIFGDDLLDEPSAEDGVVP